MPMENQSDHDLLIALNTKMEMLLAGQQQYIIQWGKMLERMTAIEIAQGRHETEIKNIVEEVNDLRKKTSVVDAINAVMAGLAGVVGFFFGPR
jgi:hypothetical protein